MSKKIVYITGCLGFIGSYVTRTILDLGWFVRGIDKCTYAANTDLLKEFSKYSNFIFENKDINNIEFLYECDYVINTAAETHVGNSIISTDSFMNTNINGVHKLLELIKNYRTEINHKPILLHFSTDEVYGDIAQGSHNEQHLLKPSNPYSATKAAADMLIMAWNRTYKVPYVIVRPTNNYGIGQYVEKLIPKSIKYLNLDRKIPLHNNGTPIRNWLHAQDTANAIVTIIQNNCINEIYNISGNTEQSNFDTVHKLINSYFDTKIDNISKFIDYDVNRNGQDVRYSLDDSKLKNLGWMPKYQFDKEIDNIVRYYKNKFIW